MKMMEMTDQFINYHREYEHKLLIISSFYSNGLMNALTEAEKELISKSSHKFYEVMGAFTDKLNGEPDLNKKLMIAHERDRYLNSIMAHYGIEYKVDEDELKK